MYFNRITTLFWAAGFAFVVGTLIPSRVVIAVGLTLGAVACVELVAGAIIAHKEHQIERLHGQRNDGYDQKQKHLNGINPEK